MELWVIILAAALVLMLFGTMLVLRPALWYCIMFWRCIRMFSLWEYISGPVFVRIGTGMSDIVALRDLKPVFSVVAGPHPRKLLVEVGNFQESLESPTYKEATSVLYRWGCQSAKHPSPP